MENMLGKIVLVKDNENPVVIISQTSEELKGLKIVKSTNECSFNGGCGCFEIPSKYLEKLKYRGKKLDNPIVDHHRLCSISNLEIRQIGVLTEEGYCKLLMSYNNHYSSLGGDDLIYSTVKDDVQNQLLKLLIK